MNAGTVQVAVVAQVSPLTVRLRGSTVDVPVQRRTAPNPAGLAVDDRVLVAIVERQVTFLGRWDPA